MTVTQLIGLEGLEALTGRPSHGSEELIIIGSGSGGAPLHQPDVLYGGCRAVTTPPIYPFLLSSSAPDGFPPNRDTLCCGGKKTHRRTRWRVAFRCRQAPAINHLRVDGSKKFRVSGTPPSGPPSTGESCGSAAWPHGRLRPSSGGIARVAHAGVQARMIRSRTLRSAGATLGGVCRLWKGVSMRHRHLLREHGSEVTDLDLQASL